MTFQKLTLTLPPMDFIVVHGVYSWVDETTRDQIIHIAKRFLKTTRYLHLSYNAFPGMGKLEPLRYLLKNLSRARNRTAIERAKKSLQTFPAPKNWPCLLHAPHKY